MQNAPSHFETKFSRMKVPTWKEDERKILLELLHSRAKKRLSEMVSPHPVMERADSAEL